jgi:tRNA(Ile)-lysidine synthase
MIKARPGEVASGSPIRTRAENATAVSDAEADAVFADLIDQPALMLAVSGGPDSTALMWLAARWRKRQRSGPNLIAVTVDHGLRPEARREAAAVKRLAARLGIAHRTLRWAGAKPITGLQEKAREARYRLIAAAAERAQATCVLTAHTLDDQAETVLFRMTRGSGLTGLSGMARMRPLLMPVAQPPADRRRGKPEPGASLFLVRPLLDVPKARLVATLLAAKIPCADDPSNRDPRFTRTRLRALAPALAAEGLDARRFALLARRVRRAEAAIEFAVAAAAAALSETGWSERGPIAFDHEGFASLPAEVALRLLGRAIARVGDEGPVQLGKLEALADALARTSAQASSQAPNHGWAQASANAARLRRTLAGAVVTLGHDRVVIERAPARRNRAPVVKSAPRAGRRGKKA